MITNELIDYIHLVRSKKVSDQGIREILRGVGWDETDIDRGLFHASLSSSGSTSHVNRFLSLIAMIAIVGIGFVMAIESYNVSLDQETSAFALINNSIIISSNKASYNLVTNFKCEEILPLNDLERIANVKVSTYTIESFTGNGQQNYIACKYNDAQGAGPALVVYSSTRNNTAEQVYTQQISQYETIEVKNLGQSSVQAIINGIRVATITLVSDGRYVVVSSYPSNSDIEQTITSLVQTKLTNI